MTWLLLNQYYASMESKSLKISVLEEVVSSELQLVQVLVSGVISSETMTSLIHGITPFSRNALVEEYRI